MNARSFAAEQAGREAERIALDIMRAFQRAARATDRSSRSLSRDAGGGRGGRHMSVGGRLRRAPSSASQFHFHAKKSKASGTGKAPVSSVNKVKYDLGLDEKDPHADRVKIAFVSAQVGIPNAARDPLKMAEACEARARQSKYANGNTGQMLHLDAALPNGLSPDRLATLAGDINQKISDRFGVPAFSGVHLDHGNFHVHSSVPLYEVIDEGQGGFTLGDRINHAKRPSEREALGLPRNPAGELRELRQDIADLIADAVAEEYPDVPHAAERWRHGHLTLPQQVEKAAERGDVQFVLDNLSREATRKEGPPPDTWRTASTSDRREAAVAHNEAAGKSSEIPPPELITGTIVQRVVLLAEKANLDRPEQFRLLGKQCGLNVHWSANNDGKVQGASFAIEGGPRVPGARVGASLGTLQKRLGWAEKPAYRRFPPKSGEEVMDYKNKMIEAKLEHVEHVDYVAKSIKVTLFRLKKIEDEARQNSLVDRAADQSAKPKPTTAAEGPSVEPPKADPAQHGTMSAPKQAQAATIKKARPKRKSNDPTYHARPPTGTRKAPSAHAPQAGLSANEKKAGAARGARQGNSAVQKQTPRQALTPTQKELLAQAWDEEQARKVGLFVGPMHEARERLEFTRAGLAKHMKAEPWPSQERRRGLFGSRLIETKEHADWQTAWEEQRLRVEQLEERVNRMVAQATSDAKLISMLPQLEKEDAAASEHQAARLRDQARRSYEQALETLKKAQPGSHQARQAYASIVASTKNDPELAERERERRAELARQGARRPQPGPGVGTYQRERPR